MNKENEAQREQLEAEVAEAEADTTQDLDTIEASSSNETVTPETLDLKGVTSQEVQKMIQDSLQEEDPWMKRKQETQEKVLDLDQ